MDCLSFIRLHFSKEKKLKIQTAYSNPIITIRLAILVCIIVLRDIVAVNSGGPYGSSVLAGVEADSSRVWAEIQASTKYDSWHKACLYVQACDSDASGRDQWSVSPRNRNGDICGGPFFFE